MTGSDTFSFFRNRHHMRDIHHPCFLFTKLFTCLMLAWGGLGMSVGFAADGAANRATGERAATTHSKTETLPSTSDSSLPSEETLLSRARIFFNSHRYQETLTALAEHEKYFPTSKNIEEAHYMLGRSLFATGQDNPDTLRKAREVLHSIFSIQDKQVSFQLAAGLWAGRCSLRLFELATETEVRLAELNQADMYFQGIMAANAIDDTDYDARYFDGMVWGHRATIEKNDTLIQEAYTKASTLLEEMLRIYQQRDRRDRSMLYIVIFQLRLRNYERALGYCEHFFKEFPESPHRIRVQVCKAEALYYSDRVSEAVTEYQAVLSTDASADILQTARYGLGWSYVRLGTNTDAESRMKYIRMAAMSLRRFLGEAEPTDARCSPATFKLAQTYVELGEHHEALILLNNVLKSPTYGMRAAYYAGEAARGLEQYEKAWGFFSAALQQARTQRYLEMELLALKSMAGSLLAANRPAEACVWYADAARLAQTVRDAGTQAEAQLGMVESLLNLGIQKGTRGMFRKKEFMASCARLCTGAPYESINPMALQRDVAVGAAAAELWDLNGIDTLRIAQQHVAILLQRQRNRLRMDELYYHQGRIFAEMGRQLSEQQKKDAPHAYEDEAAIRKILDTFGNAEEAFQQAVDVNPQGEFGTSSLFSRGKLLYDAGIFTQDIADEARKMELKHRGSNTQPPINLQAYLEESQKFLTRSTEYLILAHLQGDGEPIGNQSLYVLGMSYFALDRYDDAELAFRNLLGISNLDLGLRIMAARQMARVLEKLERPEDAVIQLAPFIENDRQTALQAGYLALELQRWQDAYAAFSAVNLPPPESPQQLEYDAELAYNRFSAALILVQTAKGKKKDTLLAEAIRGQLENAERYPESRWGYLSLMRVGEYYRKHGRYQEALQLATRGLSLLRTPEGQQEMHLLQGRVYASSGAYQDATRAFRQILLIKDTSPHTRRLRALALLELARTLHTSGNENEALTTYDRVYAIYPDEVEVADQARFEAAAILDARGWFDDALAILKAAEDAGKARQQIRDIQKKIVSQTDPEKELRFR